MQDNNIFVNDVLVETRSELKFGDFLRLGGTLEEKSEWNLLSPWQAVWSYTLDEGKAEKALKHSSFLFKVSTAICNY